MTSLKILDFSIDSTGIINNSQCSPETLTSYSTYSIKECTTINCTTVQCTTVDCTTIKCTTINCTTINCTTSNCTYDESTRDA